VPKVGDSFTSRVEQLVTPARVGVVELYTVRVGQLERLR
jgi:hypothetical protein